MQDDLLIFACLWFIAGQVAAAASDAMSMRIPNALILCLLAGYAVTTALSPPGWAGLAASAAVAAALLATGAALFAGGVMGGGDVKLLAVTGLWVGPAETPALLLLTALAGGALALALVLCRAAGLQRPVGGRVAALCDPMDRVPYGIAIAAAAVVVVVLRPVALLAG
jgi:prepilin peptidase CpaA